MRRLAFRLPEFVRTAWISDAAREHWQPRLAAIGRAWAQIEWASVRDEVRSCHLTVKRPEDVTALACEMARNGLQALPIAMQAAAVTSYAARATSAQAGDPFDFRIVVGRATAVREFMAVWEAGDDDGIGRLLGYPECCRQFFKRFWIDGRLMDTTWPMALASGVPDEYGVIEAAAHPLSNILLRWFGVRPVPHLPCRTDCEASIALGEALVGVGLRLGFQSEMGWLREMLAWPVEWSALHGIAEVRTPVLRASISTDPTATKLTVRLKGSAYPRHGGRGVVFPFTAAPPTAVDAADRTGVELETLPVSAEKWFWEDNGFPSLDAMGTAHAPVVECAVRAMREIRGDQRRDLSVLDLGCGNGALLDTLRRSVAWPVACFGVEKDPSRAERSRRVCDTGSTAICAGSMFDPSLPVWDGRDFDVAILMPGRLNEVGVDQANWLREKLRAHARLVVLYSYEGANDTGRPDLRESARRAGCYLRVGEPDIGPGIGHVVPCKRAESRREST